MHLLINSDISFIVQPNPKGGVTKKYMAKRLFVGKLPYETTNNQLEELFAQAGQVVSVNLITDKYTGQSKGFAFVEMGTEEEAQKAIQTLNGYALNGRTIVVNEARPQEDRGSRPGGGFGGNRGGGGGGNRNFSRQKRW